VCRSIRCRKDYAEEIRQRLERQLRRRALELELGFELKKFEPPVLPAAT
jgi:hypothetical protein